MPQETPPLNFLNELDFGVLALYMLTILGVGFYVYRFNRKTVDYFKGGGQVPWKLSATSLFISGFSAFMFVGASGIVYSNGGGAILLFSLALPAYLLGYLIFGPLWRRTRIDTPLQFLTRRYSQGTTYCYTVLAVIPNTLVLGIMIYTLCIFITSALGIGEQQFDLLLIQVNGFELMLLITGVVIVGYTTLGGLWAVMVTDFVQFLIVLIITLIMTPLAFSLLGDGNAWTGLSRLFTDAPDGYFEIKLDGKPALFWPTYFLYIIFGYNVNWHIAQRYYSVADERDTKKMALTCSVFSFVLPMLWVLPVMVTPILFPNIEALWPEIAQPSEASFVTLALAVLPHGLLGLLVAAIFSATMSSTDTLFNWLAAVLTKDVYVPLASRVKGKAPSERQQLWVGRLCVASLGIFAIWVAFNVQRFGGAFDVYMRAESLYKITLFVPVFLGLLFTRTPWWSAIASIAVGGTGVLIIGVVATLESELPLEFMNILFADIKVTWLGFDLTRYELNALVGLILTSAVFFGSAFFNQRQGAFKKRIESLETDLRTPAYSDQPNHISPVGLKAYELMGKLAMGLGVAMTVLALLTWGEGAFLNQCAGIISFLIGVVIYRSTLSARNATVTENLNPDSHDST